MLPTAKGQGGGGSNLFTPGKKKRINVVAVALNAFLPWAVFCGIFATLTFSFHYNHPALAWTVVAAGLLLTFLVGGLAWRAKKHPERDPSW